MSDNEYLWVVSELNSELYDQHNECEWLYWYRTNGFAEQIGFHDVVLWCSEANGTEYDPETDEEIPMIDVIRASAQRHAKKFNKLAGEPANATRTR